MQRALKDIRIVYHLDGLPEPFRDIQHTIHPVGWNMYFHRHAFLQLILVKSGQAEVRTDRAFELEAGQVAILPPKLSHTWRNVGAMPLDMLNIHIRPGLPAFADIEKYLLALCMPTRGLGICPPQLPLIAMEEKIAGEIRAGDPLYKHRIAALLMQIVIAVIRAALENRNRRTTGTRRTPRIEKALWFIEANYARPLSLADISRVLGISAHHCCDLFSAEIGMPPMRYVQKTRIEKAKLLLEQTGLRIGEVAREVGIEDEHYFSKLFHKTTRLAPTEYRLRFRN